MAVPVITPGGPLAKRGKAVQALTATGGVTSWTTSGGALSGTGPAGATWTAPNISETYTVTATNADGSDVLTIVVIAVVPFVPDWDFEGEEGKRFLVYKPDVGQRQSVILGDEDTFPFIRNTAQKAEYDEMRKFWRDNYAPGILVYFTIPGHSEELWELDSNFKRHGRRTNLWGYSLTLLRAT
jgi:hypothetical protein